MIFHESAKSLYLLYVLKIIDLYTDINIEWDNKDYSVTRQFEELDEYDLIEFIISLVVKKTAKVLVIREGNISSTEEIELIQSILRECMADIEKNENNLVLYVDTMIESVGLVLNALIDSFWEKMIQLLIKQLEMNLSEEDIEAFKKAKNEQKDIDNVISFPLEEKYFYKIIILCYTLYRIDILLKNII